MPQKSQGTHVADGHTDGCKKCETHAICELAVNSSNFVPMRAVMFPASRIAGLKAFEFGRKLRKLRKLKDKNNILLA